MFGFIKRKIIKKATDALFSGIKADLREILEARDAILRLKVTGEVALADGNLSPEEVRDIIEGVGEAAEQTMEAVQVIQSRIDTFR